METQAEIGQFNERFWTDWHYRLGLARPDQTAPVPPKRMGKLRWCSRCGMKELALLTPGYLEQHFPTAPA